MYSFREGNLEEAETAGPTEKSGEVSIRSLCGLLDGLCTQVVIDFVAADGSVSQHAHSVEPDGSGRNKKGWLFFF